MTTTNRTPVPEHLRPQEPPITGKQLTFLQDLMNKKDLFASPKWFDAVNAMDAEEYEQHLTRTIAGLSRLTKKQASACIEALLALPNDTTNTRATATAGASSTAHSEVPDGHYALRVDDIDDPVNPVRFYRVNKGKDYSASGGRDWTGFTFVDRYAGDDHFPVKGAERDRVLSAIERDPFGAAQLYGRESQRCCICNRNLTRKLSRELGIGPVCGGRNEWLNDQLVAEARERITARGENPDEEV